MDETSEIDVADLPAYGYNRYQLERWTRKNFPDALIIRLPGLFGRNLKKNSSMILSTDSLYVEEFQISGACKKGAGTQKVL